MDAEWEIVLVSIIHKGRGMAELGREMRDKI
jgi:hypothetical protein